MNRIILWLVISFFAVVTMVGWNKIENLERENASLVTKLHSLEKMNARLRETDQAYFNRAVDYLNKSRSKDDFILARQSFLDLIKKFPHTSYIVDAKNYIADIEKKIESIEKVENLKKSYNTSLSSHQFSQAETALNMLKPLISNSEFLTLSKALYEEKNKPLETTINKLVSEYGARHNSVFPGQVVLGMIGKRVKFDATFVSVDRDRKVLNAYSDGWVEGSNIEVYYGSSNLNNYFTNHDPRCCSNRFTVIGKIQRYSNTLDSFYVYAEKIEAVK